MIVVPLSKLSSASLGEYAGLISDGRNGPTVAKVSSSERKEIATAASLAAKRLASAPAARAAVGGPVWRCDICGARYTAMGAAQACERWCARVGPLPAAGFSRDERALQRKSRSRPLPAAAAAAAAAAAEAALAGDPRVLLGPDPLPVFFFL